MFGGLNMERESEEKDQKKVSAKHPLENYTRPRDISSKDSIMNDFLKTFRSQIAGSSKNFISGCICQYEGDDDEFCESTELNQPIEPNIDQSANDKLIDKVIAKLIPQVHRALPELCKSWIETASERSKALMDSASKDLIEFRIKLDSWEARLNEKWSEFSNCIVQAINNQANLVASLNEQVMQSSNVANKAFERTVEIKNDCERLSRDLRSASAQISGIKDELNIISNKFDISKQNFWRPEAPQNPSGLSFSPSSSNSNIRQSPEYLGLILEREIKEIKKDYSESLFVISNRIGNMETVYANFRSEIGKRVKADWEECVKTIEELKLKVSKIPVLELLKVRDDIQLINSSLPQYYSINLLLMEQKEARQDIKNFFKIQTESINSLVSLIGPNSKNNKII